MSRHMSGQFRLCAAALCLVVVAIFAWAFLGSGLRILARGPYDAIVSVALQMPSMSAQVAAQLTRKGYVSMLDLYAISNIEQGSGAVLVTLARAVNGDVVAAALVWLGVGSVAAAAMMSACRSKVEGMHAKTCF
jgi:uncharacterized membrane protein YphA (DoxX/SURF4 family)